MLKQHQKDDIVKMLGKNRGVLSFIDAECFCYLYFKHISCKKSINFIYLFKPFIQIRDYVKYKFNYTRASNGDIYIKLISIHVLSEIIQNDMIFQEYCATMLGDVSYPDDNDYVTITL